jgi:glyoxylase-like metal-dependent hydrolase (beta-lactamase superfamily II)
VIEFTEIANRVFVARTQPLDVNVSLVIGDESALVIDTLSTNAQAQDLVSAIRALTTVPLTVLNTHYHFDHTFGNAVVAAGGRPIWAHPNAASELREGGGAGQADLVAAYRERDPEFADALAEVTISVPDHLVRATELLDLGGRSVTVAYHGRGHTDGDLVAIVDDVNVLFAGDLVEEGAWPSFGEDSYPLAWPEAVAALRARATSSTIVVPGHGALVDTEFVSRLHGQLSEFAWLIRDGHLDGASIDEIAAQAPFPAQACRGGVERGYALLDDPVFYS